MADGVLLTLNINHINESNFKINITNEMFSLINFASVESGRKKITMKFPKKKKKKKEGKRFKATNYCIRFGHSLWSAVTVASAGG